MALTFSGEDTWLGSVAMRGSPSQSITSEQMRHLERIGFDAPIIKNDASCFCCTTMSFNSGNLEVHRVTRYGSRYFQTILFGQRWSKGMFRSQPHENSFGQLHSQSKPGQSQSNSTTEFFLLIPSTTSKHIQLQVRPSLKPRWQPRTLKACIRFKKRMTSWLPPSTNPVGERRRA